MYTENIEVDTMSRAVYKKLSPSKAPRYRRLVMDPSPNRLSEQLLEAIEERIVTG